MSRCKLLNITLVLFIWLLYPCAIQGQVTLIVEGLPDNTPLTDGIYISGNFEGWTGGQDIYKLTYDKGQHKITLPLSEETIHFKFTRGTWESVELNSDGGQLDNRSFSFSLGICLLL